MGRNQFVDDAGDTRLDGELVGETTPGPFRPAAGSDVTVLEDADGTPLIRGGDDLGGVELNSPDGDTSLIVTDVNVTVEGDVLIDGGEIQMDNINTVVAPNALIPVGRITSKYTLTSGALPDLGAWVSGTPKQNPVNRQVTVNVEVVGDHSANVATAAIAISPDNVTYTTIGTPGASAAINTSGAVTSLAAVTLPEGWWIKVTLSHATVAPSVYY